MAAGKKPQVILSQLQRHKPVLEQLDKMYSDAYEDLQLSVRLVDWLVASEGCDWLLMPRDGADVVTNHAAAFGWLFNVSREHVWAPWTHILTRRRLKRVGESVIRELRSLVVAAPMLHSQRRPFECAARRTAQYLCSPDRIDVVRYRQPVVLM
eukprot:TRINITY_DN15126_c0_g1_i1.p1 TRINITY_DN15126_c0_g1~~TRINITY_DN15126_c0_g1_i1.p1  ORF type:complete len:166 (+),score=19.31 TRINITY_DN15126_c0_g1_i1:40-498(+)